MSNVDQIKSRLDIADVIGSYIKLDKAGGNFKACCPFHNEKTPSFYVSPSKAVWHCFGCGVGGDIFSFVMEIEKVEFIDALKILAKKAGVELAREDPKARSEKNRLLGLMEDGKNFYKNELFKKQDVLDYLKNRGLAEETIKEFELGFAPDGWRGIYDYLRGKNYSDSEIEKSGLIIRNLKHGASQKFYDRFRNRIMFPINDQGGRTVAFGGRSYGSPRSVNTSLREPYNQGNANAFNLAKYINSPQTLIYDKSKILYNFDKAKLDTARYDYCVIVEGYMDAIMSYAAGAHNTVAVSGTALTKDHLNLISRLTKKAITSFDSDDAGITATGRSLGLLISSGFEVKIVKLNEKDPADFINKNGKEAWSDYLKNSLHIIDFYLKHIEEKCGSDKKEVINKIQKIVFPYLLFTQNEMEKSFWIKKIAAVADLKEEAVWNEFVRLKSKIPKTTKKESYGTTSTVDKTRIEHLEKRILCVLAYINSKEPISDDIKEIILKKENIFSGNFKKFLDFFLSRGEMSEEEKTFLNTLALEAEFIYNSQVEEVEEIVKELKILLNELLKESIKKELEALTVEIKKLETGNSLNKEEISKRIEEFNRLSKELLACKNGNGI